MLFLKQLILNTLSKKSIQKIKMQIKPQVIFLMTISIMISIYTFLLQYFLILMHENIRKAENYSYIELIIILFIIINIYVLVKSIGKSLSEIAYANLLLALKSLSLCVVFSLIILTVIHYMISWDILRSTNVYVFTFLLFPLILVLTNLQVKSIDNLNNGIIYRLINFIVRQYKIEKDISIIFCKNLTIEGYFREIERYICSMINPDKVEFISKFMNRDKYFEILNTYGMVKNMQISTLFGNTGNHNKNLFIVPMKVNKNEINYLLIYTNNERKLFSLEDFEHIKKIIKSLEKYYDKFMISSKDIVYCLKNLHNTFKLEKSILIRLEKIEERRRIMKKTSSEILQSMIWKKIDKFKPAGQSSRTLAMVRYEILRMAAHEGATENQIMWDLGFDCHIKIVSKRSKHESKPRYRVKHENEYRATSIRSFKRIKKETIEMFGWSLVGDR